MRGPLFALLTCALGCASGSAPAPIPLPIPPPSPWYLVTTPNFVVHADLDAASAVRAAEALEDARDALVSVAWPRLDFDNLEPTQVYVVATVSALQRSFGIGTLGIFYGGRELRVFLGGKPDQWERRPDPRFGATSYLRHELAHQLSSLVYRRQPRWFAEGLAQFLETAVYSKDGTTVAMGAPNIEALTMYRTRPSLSVRQMLDWERARAGGRRPPHEFAQFYGLSWLLVHWLYNTRAEAFARFQHALAEGTDPSVAWDAAFPGFDFEAADRVLEKYSHQGVYTVRTFAVQRKRRSFLAVALSPADEHACRALIARSASFVDVASREGLLAESRAETLAARALDPDNVEALSVDFEGDPLDLLTRARRAVAAHPNDARAYLLMSRAREAEQPDGPAAEAALRQAVALSPGSSSALNNLAWLLLETGRAAEAMGFAMRAVRSAPWNANVLDTYARALFLSGACERALAIQRQATDVSEDLSQPGAALAERRKHLAEYEAKCGDPE